MAPPNGTWARSGHGGAVFPSSENEASAPPLEDVESKDKRVALLASPSCEEAPSTEAHGDSSAPPSASAGGDQKVPPMGAKVTVVGLEEHSELNGRVGFVVGHTELGVIVDLVDGESNCLFEPQNLQWGLRRWCVEVPHFMIPKMVTSTYDGVVTIRVPPPVVAGTQHCWGNDESGLGNYVKMLAWMWLGFSMAVFSWISSLALLSVALLRFSVSAMCWRWLAHRHLDILLSARPPSRGAIISRPSADIRGGTSAQYFGDGHTWRCFFYVLLVAMPLSLLSTALSLGTAAFTILNVSWARNMLSALSWLERSAAMCFVGRHICDYHKEFEQDVYRDQTESMVAFAYDSAVVEMEAREQYTEGIQGEGGVASMPSTAFLVQRDRTQEELVSIDKFNASFTCLFGKAPKLKDVVIQPPREPGLGPRHFITMANSITDRERFRLIKAYKQAFSSMYVHIVDAEELQRQEGTDYSALYT